LSLASLSNLAFQLASMAGAYSSEECTPLLGRLQVLPTDNRLG